MAGKQKAEEQTGPPVFSEADQGRAREWFKKAADLRERRDYEYAVECYINGLGYWPEAVEVGHRPLHSLAIQRQQAGGKKPGMMDSMKRSMTGKDVKKAMLNAEYLLSLDPQNGGYAEGLLRNANKAGYLQTIQWVAEIVFDSIKRDKKPNKARFKSFRDTLVEAATRADAWDRGVLETWFLEQAVQSLDFAVMRMPTEAELRDEQRDLSGRLTIARGKYEEADSFRDSLQDADAQKLLHDSDRAKQSEQSLEALIEAHRKKYAEEPQVAANLTRLIDALMKGEHRAHEDEAIDILMQAFAKSDSYAHKSRADDIRLRQLTRQARKLMAKARQSGSDGDRQQARLAAMEQRQVALDTYRERVGKYPTDLRLKFKFGSALFDAGEYDEAIPMLQEASGDPRSRTRAEFMIGRAFLEKDVPGQAAEVLRESLDKYELVDDHSKNLLYWLGRAYQADGKLEEAKAAYGKLLRRDYNFMDGDARKRLDELK